MPVPVRLAVCAVVLACSMTSAFATVRITEDGGGQIGDYVEAYTTLKSRGEKVVVDGDCLSACTLLLGIVPSGQMCATARARFGFHAAWNPDAKGDPVTSENGTRALWHFYPKAVRAWITRHGGLSPRMAYLYGRDLLGIIPLCDRPGQTRGVQARAHGVSPL